MIDCSKCYACMGCSWEREISSQSQIDNCKDYRPRPKPNRFEQFREQTATIDGLVEFCIDNDLCYCANRATCESDDSLEHCKAGIKAYWESEA